MSYTSLLICSHILVNVPIFHITQLIIGDVISNRYFFQGDVVNQSPKKGHLPLIYRTMNIFTMKNLPQPILSNIPPLSGHQSQPLCSHIFPRRPPSRSSQGAMVSTAILEVTDLGDVSVVGCGWD